MDVINSVIFPKFVYWVFVSSVNGTGNLQLGEVTIYTSITFWQEISLFGVDLAGKGNNDSLF